jgi:hypothetical protein
MRLFCRVYTVQCKVLYTHKSKIEKPPVISQTVAFSTMPALCRNVMKEFTSVPAEWTLICAAYLALVYYRSFFLQFPASFGLLLCQQCRNSDSTVPEDAGIEPETVKLNR